MSFESWPHLTCSDVSTRNFSHFLVAFIDLNTVRVIAHARHVQKFRSLSGSFVCNFALLADEYGMFDSLLGFLMDPDAFSGIFELSATLGVHLHMYNMSLRIPGLTG